MLGVALKKKLGIGCQLPFLPPSPVSSFGKMNNNDSFSSLSVFLAGLHSALGMGMSYLASFTGYAYASVRNRIEKKEDTHASVSL